jgi:hypothetical protein
MKTPEIEPVPGGFRVRLRVGAGKRLRVTIPLTDERTAQRRATQLHDMARALVRAKQTAKAQLVLTQAAEQHTEADFRSVAAVVAELCAAAGKPVKPAKTVPTFRELGEALDEWRTPQALSRSGAAEGHGGRRRQPARPLRLSHHRLEAGGPSFARRLRGDHAQHSGQRPAITPPHRRHHRPRLPHGRLPVPAYRGVSRPKGLPAAGELPQGADVPLPCQ